MTTSIALIGDYDESVTAHRAIESSLKTASADSKLHNRYQWIASDKVRESELSTFDGVWCVPASPYRSTEGAISAIRYARESKTPFLGSCGGYQHAALEFARNRLGYVKADNSEINPDCEMPLISPLVCKLVESSDLINVLPDTRLASIIESASLEQDYNCSFGINPEHVDIFNGSEMVFSAWDQAGEPRAFELNNHPFFIATAFQPERSALKGRLHPLIAAFIAAAASVSRTGATL